MARSELHFPEGFLWGTATSSHQVEGHNTNNDWWAWEQVPGHIRDGDRSGPACEWWQRAEEDLDRAAALGQNTHRLSLEWSRLEPRAGEWNDAAFERYRQILRGLRTRGMEPMVTLFHFTLPQWLSALGGWTNPETIRYFGRFTSRVMEELGEHASLWVTINEPSVYAFIGYLAGDWPPGRRSLPMALRVVRNLLLAHADAYRIIHAVQGHAQVGIANNLFVAEPRRRGSGLDTRLTQLINHVYNIVPLNAASSGRLGPFLGFGHVPKLVDSVDFIGVNYYTRFCFGVQGNDPAESLSPQLVAGCEASDLRYGEIYPHGLYQVLKRVQHYGKPIYVTENGLPDADDSRRPRFILTHLAEMWRAMQEGVRVRGYYHWSLVDNFEWSEGYAMRFGLIGVDFRTQARQIRDSGRMYGEICQTNTISEELVQRYAPAAAPLVFNP